MANPLRLDLRLYVLSLRNADKQRLRPVEKSTVPDGKGTGVTELIFPATIEVLGT
ncbi:hypothetical protein NITMOv2_4750 [Nitrospira moscoviensis]|uniref:Uncharacterized protein n=1 Tax=Nitrospira moscoviensis TaxID=42253 RepID=A0A0K2GJU1_NITMO|nr:hypothetical protein NITMOv2_4750 [Nitrospira moscoviensis]